MNLSSIKVCFIEGDTYRKYQYVLVGAIYGKVFSFFNLDDSNFQNDKCIFL